MYGIYKTSNSSKEGTPITSEAGSLFNNNSGIMINRQIAYSEEDTLNHANEKSQIHNKMRFLQ